MSARTKLNAAAVAGALLFAALVGGLSGSAAAFWVTFIVLLIFDLASGSIRLRRR